MSVTVPADCRAFNRTFEPLGPRKMGNTAGTTTQKDTAGYPTDTPSPNRTTNATVYPTRPEPPPSPRVVYQPSGLFTTQQQPQPQPQAQAQAQVQQQPTTTNTVNTTTGTSKPVKQADAGQDVEEIPMPATTTINSGTQNAHGNTGGAGVCSVCGALNGKSSQQTQTDCHNAHLQESYTFTSVPLFRSTMQPARYATVQRFSWNANANANPAGSMQLQDNYNSSSSPQVFYLQNNNDSFVALQPRKTMLGMAVEQMEPAQPPSRSTEVVLLRLPASHLSYPGY